MLLFGANGETDARRIGSEAVKDAVS